MDCGGAQIILRKVLLNLNLESDEAENGQIAVDLHRQGRRYGLVLMDKEMPVMDGHEATRQLRSMGVKTPIVALTGNALTTDREVFFEAGVDDFQTKVRVMWCGEVAGRDDVDEVVKVGMVLMLLEDGSWGERM